jgi:putative membrane protein
MLAVHPVQEVIRAAPALFGLLVAGSSSGNGGRWGLIGVAVAIGAGTMRWFTTRYRITPEQIQLKHGLLRRQLRAVARDRVRTVDVTAGPLHRVLGLVRVTIGTGRSDHSSEGGLRLDGLTVAEASGLRDELLHGRPRPEAPAGAGVVRVSAPASTSAEAAIATLRPEWIRYGPFTLSGIVTVGVLGGFVINAANDARVDPRSVGPLRDLGDALASAPLAGAIAASAVALVLLVAVLSTAGYVLAFWGFRLTRNPGGTLHVARGLATTRQTTIEERRLRGVELSEPLLLRAVGGARCIAIATGLRVGRGAERGGSLLLPPAPRAEAERVAAEVLRVRDPVTAPLTPHGPRARQRRFTRALAGCVPIVVVAFALTRLAAWSDWVWEASLLSVPAAVALAGDRARSLGHTVTPTSLVARVGSVVRRRSMLSREGIIGLNLRRSFFQRRVGLMTLTATTAAGSQAYAVLDVADAEALRICEEAMPGLLAPFLAAGSADGALRSDVRVAPTGTEGVEGDGSRSAHFR